MQENSLVLFTWIVSLQLACKVTQNDNNDNVIMMTDFVAYKKDQQTVSNGESHCVKVDWLSQARSYLKSDLQQHASSAPPSHVCAARIDLR